MRRQRARRADHATAVRRRRRRGRRSRTITVTGQGSATVKPDIATVQLGVSVNRPTADAALQQANTSAAALIDALKGAGVADDDIVTSNLSIWPQWDNSRVTGYTASNSVSVTVRDIDQTGPVIDAAAAAAGTDIAISGISFGLDDPEQVMSAARADAMANAAKRAGEFAAAAGAGVGTVLQISETVVTPYVPTVYDADAASATTGPPDRADADPDRHDRRLGDRQRRLRPHLSRPIEAPAGMGPCRRLRASVVRR